MVREEEKSSWDNGRAMESAYTTLLEPWRPPRPCASCNVSIINPCIYSLLQPQWNSTQMLYCWNCCSNSYTPGEHQRLFIEVSKCNVVFLIWDMNHLYATKCILEGCHCEQYIFVHFLLSSFTDVWPDILTERHVEGSRSGQVIT